ncbi:MAG: YraN family protein [Clostridia bacterium]|nr:YraN family protein [Clostridia bacterium]
MEKYNKTVGNFGEEMATKYIEKQHYKILDRNFNTRLGELDIVALNKDCLCFIEVKTRTTDKYGKPMDAVNYVKRNHLINAAKIYITKNKLINYKARFDIVEVFVKKDDNNFEVEKINLIKNAFMC